jgi:hypothetical protein
MDRHDATKPSRSPIAAAGSTRLSRAATGIGTKSNATVTSGI